MKKFVAVVMMVVLVTLSLGMAQAEVRYTNVRPGMREVNEGEWENYYIAEIISDSGDKVEIELTYEEFVSARDEFVKEVAKVETDNRPWYKKAISRITFWNSND